MSLLEERMKAPLHQGSLEGMHGVGSVGNPACGDVVTVRVRLRDGVVERARFQSTGSPYQLAAASVMCDLAEGLSLEEALTLDAAPVIRCLGGLPREKRHLVRLAVDALHLAVTDAQTAQ